MFKLEPRAAPSKVLALTSPLIALAITVVIGTVLFIVLGKSPLTACRCSSLSRSRAFTH